MSFCEVVVPRFFIDRYQDVVGMGLLVAGIQADHHGESADRELFSGSVIPRVATCTGQRDVSAGGVVRVRLMQGGQQN
ncbi:hypothetical protein GCM10017788_80200 [Amycolatopsis acidiphila]|nr:hypothetical protein GCM10017788_80200 [Amycolatopsis acidiphila]